MEEKTFLETILIKEVIGPIIVIVASLLLYYILKNIIKKAFKIQKKHLTIKHIDHRRQITLCNLVVNVVKYLILIIDVVIILGIFGINTAAIVTSLGVVGVVVGLALQDILKDFIAGFTIMLENQYTVGDTVTIGTFKGEVISLSLKTTKLKAYTGEVNIIANRNVIEVINHSIENSLAVVNVSVDYSEDIEKVEKVLNELFTKLNKEIVDLKGEITIAGVNNLGPASVEIMITAETKPMQQAAVQRILLKEIKEVFDANKIKVPHTQLVLNNG